MTTISKTAQVLKYFAQQYQSPGTRRGIPRVRLMKMAYLSDLLAREHMGRPLTDFDYKHHKFGPYDDRIRDAIRELENAGLGEARDVWDGDVQTKELLNTGGAIAFDFTPAEAEILRYVAANYLGLPMQELLHDIVYPTAPMVAAPKKGTVLPMSLADNVKRDIIRFDLEDVLAAEREIDAGNGVGQFF